MENLKHSIRKHSISKYSSENNSIANYSIKAIYNKKELFLGKEIIVSGTIKFIRDIKDIIFINLYDGSTCLLLNLTLKKINIKVDIKNFNFNSSIRVSGILNTHFKNKNEIELEVKEILYIEPVRSLSVILQKKKIPISTLSNYFNSRNKTFFFSTVLRLRNKIIRHIENFLEELDFIKVYTPIITNNLSEGGSDAFKIDSIDQKNEFFNNKSFLTVSGQLHLESITQALFKTYIINPCFRAEKSKTTKHLSEFWMLEVEMAHFTLLETIKLSESLIKEVIKKLLHENREELIFLEKISEDNIIKNLENIQSKNFIIIEYLEAIEIVNKKLDQKIEFGFDLSSECEKIIVEHFNSPVFIINFPEKIKAFYMKANDDKKTVNSFDLIMPEVGELIGGSVRENNFEILKEKANNIKNLDWYIELRNQGYSKTSGFGLGIERFIMFLLGIKNIKYTLPFPISYSNLNF